MKFAVIGLGSFGFNVAKTLFEKGAEVMALDKNKERLKDLQGFASHAVSMDAAVKENLEALGIQDMDVVVVSLGHDMEASILTVLYLAELGVERIIAKALTEDHAKILEAVGATEIIFPEKDMAVRTALKLNNPNILEYLPLGPNIGIQEIAPSEKFIGKSLKELDIRRRYGVQIIAVRELIPEETTFVPGADFVIKDSDVLVIMGDDKSLAKFSANK
ncbi:MAG: TrkA family potassium uptake protein [Acidobacteria bacterium]|nr:TrkA family potassium uptake protein [Acidobacteriota bacterium]